MGFRSIEGIAGVSSSSWISLSRLALGFDALSASEGRRRSWSFRRLEGKNVGISIEEEGDSVTVDMERRMEEVVGVRWAEEE
jgi:hypothetical protein